MKSHTLVVFPSRLGWMAMIAAETAVKQLTFGHRTAAAAKTALDGELLAECGGDCCTVRAKRTGIVRREANGSIEALVQRLQAYAFGTPDDFRNVRIDPGRHSLFERQVVAQCRRIPYGATISYAELAAQAGHQGAARAVGNCIAANRTSLLVPCHRVVCSDGRIGAYSAPGGTQMKRRLLALESSSIVPPWRLGQTFLYCMVCPTAAILDRML